MNRFDITKGQAKAWSILSRSHSAGRGASTYLFYGPEGVGHWAMAVELAALLNCASPLEDAEIPGVRYPCRDCSSCRAVYGLNSEAFQTIVPIPSHKNESEAIDLINAVLELKREEPFASVQSTKQLTIPIARAREVKRGLSVRGAEGVTRVVLFYQMDKMRASSADALLKLIEEPPPDTVIVLTTSNPDGLLPTIQSRSQRIRLERLPETQVVEYLMDSYGASADDARLAFRIAEGSLGVALRDWQSDSAGETDLRRSAFQLFTSLVRDESPATVSLLQDLVNFQDRGETARIVGYWQSFIRDCAWLAQTGQEDGLVNVDYAAELRQLAPVFGNPDIVAGAVAAIRNTLADLPLNVHIQAALAALVLKLKTQITAASAGAARE